MSSRRVEVLRRHLQRSNEEESSKGIQANNTAFGQAKRTKFSDSYDFIVVGAGSAGCAVAARLSENPNVTVLLIEAGNDHRSKEVRSPFIHCPDLQNSDRDWRFRTEPQPGTLDHVSYWPRGKTMGGTSCLNFMLYVRGDPRTYDYWANDLGCEGWGYQDCLPYFQKCENYMGAKGDHDVRGKDGPIDVTNLADDHEVFDTKETIQRFVEACEEMGLPRTSDYNGHSQTGAAPSQVNIRNGTRCDAASGYLFNSGAVHRPNLTVVTDCMVTKVLIQGDAAVGVCLKRGNQDLSGLADAPRGAQARLREAETVVVHARKEVVLSAGSVCTPWLLMLSGVGPAEHLRAKGVPVVKDLPVGQNLQDHMFFVLEYPLKEQGGSRAFNPRSPWHVAKNLWGHLVAGTGLFNYPWVQGLAHFRSRLQPEKVGNDIQIQVVPMFPNDAAAAERNFGATVESHGPILDVAQNATYGVTFLPTILLPKSTGAVTLRSSDPLEYPSIDPRYYSHPDDLAIALEACKFVERVTEQSQSYRGWFAQPREDPANPHPAGTDEHRIHHIRNRSITVYHPTSTARMGPPDEPNAVCDLKLKVRGIRGLRIADASVLPTVTSGNTNVPAIMVGERAADFIKEEWKL